jgi:hypothetical protein
MAAFTPWKVIPQDAWVFPTTWAGNGSRQRRFPSFAFPDVQFSPIISWRRCLYLLYMAAGRAPMIPLDEALRPELAFWRIPFTKAVTGEASTNKRSLATSMDLRFASSNWGAGAR